jgi:Esterase-like activity of phytase
VPRDGVLGRQTSAGTALGERCRSARSTATPSPIHAPSKTKSPMSCSPTESRKSAITSPTTPTIGRIQADPDTGNTIKLYLTELRKDGSTSKRLLLNLDALGIPLDNVEGMAFGPRLRHGQRTLLLVSDNNFAAAQFTQFLLFAVKGR